jgi:hypothetical protein
MFTGIPIPSGGDMTRIDPTDRALKPPTYAA